MSIAARPDSPNRPKGMFSAGEVSRLCGVPHRTVDFWARMKVVVPDIEAQGAGTDRWYSADSVVAVMICGKVGLSLTNRRQLVEAFRADPWPPHGILRYRISPMLEVFVNVARIRVEVTR